MFNQIPVDVSQTGRNILRSEIKKIVNYFEKRSNCHSNGIIRKGDASATQNGVKQEDSFITIDFSTLL
jgi:hypothetical protein